MSSQVEFPCIRFDDGSGVLVRSRTTGCVRFPHAARLTRLAPSSRVQPHLEGRQYDQGRARLARRRRDLHDQGCRRADGWHRVLRHRRRSRTGRAGSHCGVREVRRPRPRTRQGRNPRTGEPVAVPASKAPSFKPAKVLRDTVYEYRDGTGGHMLATRFRNTAAARAYLRDADLQDFVPGITLMPDALSVAGHRTAVHTHLADHETILAGRSGRNSCDPTQLRTLAQTRAEIEPPSVRVPLPHTITNELDKD